MHLLTETDTGQRRTACDTDYHPATKNTSRVTCKSCKKTRAFRKAVAELMQAAGYNVDVTEPSRPDESAA